MSRRTTDQPPARGDAGPSRAADPDDARWRDVSRRPPRPPKPLQPELLYIDEDLIVVDKPPGIVSAPGQGGETAVEDLLRGRGPVPADAPFRIVQRLDKDTSGVIVYARTLDAQRRLTEQFENRLVEKTYVALVCGHVAEDGEIDAAIEVDKRAHEVRISPRRGKPSRTRYHVLERLPGNTLLECRPLTGRTHQIRVHLASIGHPLSVDPTYGGGECLLLSHYKRKYRSNRSGEEKPLISRLTLHAQRLAFNHPRTGERVVFEAPLPKDLRAAINQLRRAAAGRD